MTSTLNGKRGTGVLITIKTWRIQGDVLQQKVTAIEQRSSMLTM